MGDYDGFRVVKCRFGILFSGSNNPNESSGPKSGGPMALPPEPYENMFI